GVANTRILPKGPLPDATRPRRASRPVCAGTSARVALRTGVGRAGSAAPRRPDLPARQSRSEPASTAHPGDRAAVHTRRSDPAASDSQTHVRLELRADRALRWRQPGAAAVLPIGPGARTSPHHADALGQPAPA